MRKVYKTLSVILISCFLSLSINGCYGNFTLTKKLYNWNGTVGSKYVNSAVMWVLMILPVYEIAGFVDVAILNLIQFWSGKNPMAMEEGEKETQLVKMDGVNYQVSTTKNRFNINSIDGEEVASLIFNEPEQAWYISNKQNSEIKLSQFDLNRPNILQLIKPDGQTLTVDLQKDIVVSE